MTKQRQISHQLDTIQLEDIGDDENDDYMALGRLAQRIYQLSPMARIKGRDDEAKVRFLTRAMVGRE